MLDKRDRLAAELEATRRELAEARAVIAAIRQGEADAVVIETEDGPRAYTLHSADEPYRTIVETLKEGAATITGDGVILYCNDAFARLAGRGASQLIGSSFADLAGEAAIAALTEAGGTAGQDFVLLGAEGRRLSCRVSSTPHQANGTAIWCLLVTDLTGQELRLRHNAIIESTDDAVMSFDLEGRITSWNRAAERLFGYTAEEALRHDAGLLVAALPEPPPGETLRGAFDEALGGRKFHKDTQRVAKDGTILDVSVTASPIRAPDGSIAGVSAIMRDIRDRKRAERQLRENEARLRVALDAAGAGMWEWDVATGAVSWSPRCYEILGVAQDAVDGTLEGFDRLLHPQDRERVWRTVRACVEDGSRYECEFRIVRPAGETAWVANVGQIVAGPSGKRVIGTIVDITKRKEAENKLRESEARLRMALDIGRAGTWQSVPATGEFHASDAALALHGLPPGTLMTHDVALGVVHPDDRARVEDALRRTLETGAPFELDLRCLEPEGAVRWLHSRAELQVQGGEKRLVGLVQDITERKEAEEKLRESQERLSMAKSTARLGVHDYDVVSGRIEWDQRVRELWGVGPNEPITYETFMAGLHPDDRAATQQAVDSALDATGDGTYSATYRVIGRADGCERWIEATGQAFFDQGRPRRLIGAVLDITERKWAAEREHLLMREVNHRAKNMLSVVHAIARHTAASEPQTFVERFGERIQALAASHDLLVKSGWKNVPLNGLVRSQLGHFRDAIGSRITIAGPDLNISAAAAQAIGLAIHELATNAIKYGALSNETGSVAISWRCGDGAEPHFALSWTEADGPAVNPPTRRGFGSTVIGAMIKMSLEGEVELDYRVSGLRWHLSCHPGKVLEGGADRVRPRAGNDLREQDPVNSPRVLVIEDEAIIAMEVAAILQQAGFEVVGPAGSVSQALKLLDESGCEAAVLDINLGQETSEPIARRLVSSGTPFVTVSGYEYDQVPQAFAKAPLIGKPLNGNLLIKELKRCLTSIV